MRKMFYMSCIILFLVACGSGKKASSDSTKGYGSPKVKQELVNDQMLRIKEYATDETYGYTEQNPVMVGGGKDGPLNERRFLNALAGPNGEEVYYRRLGSCCAFYTKNGTFGDTGLLDKYEVTFEGWLAGPVIIYINMYDSDVLKVPKGFSLKK